MLTSEPELHQDRVQIDNIVIEPDNSNSDNELDDEEDSLVDISESNDDLTDNDLSINLKIDYEAVVLSEVEELLKLSELSWEVVQDKESDKEYIVLKFSEKSEAETTFLDLEPKLPKNTSIEFNYNTISHPGNVYVRGLAVATTQDDLFDYFSKFGDLISSKILVKESANSEDKLYGFLNFKNHLVAEKVIKQCNGLKIFGGKELYLNNYISKKERFLKMRYGNDSSSSHHPGLASHNYKILFIENLKFDMCVEELLDTFGKYGQIDNYYLPRDPSTNLIKGFAFIKFHKNSQSLNCLLQLSGSFKIAISQLKHNYFLTNDQLNLVNYNDFQETNLYIKNLPVELSTDDQLAKIFEKFGDIVSAKIITDSEGNSKNYGFVCFSDKKMAINGLVGLNGKLINGKKVEISFAQKNNHHHHHHNASSNSANGAGNPQAGNLQSRKNSHNSYNYVNYPPYNYVYYSNEMLKSPVGNQPQTIPSNNYTYYQYPSASPQPYMYPFYSNPSSPPNFYFENQSGFNSPPLAGPMVPPPFFVPASSGVPGGYYMNGYPGNNGYKPELEELNQQMENVEI